MSFVQISYAKVVTTDVPVDAIGTAVELAVTRAGNRQAVEIVNCTTGTVKIAQTTDSTLTSSTIVMDDDNFDASLSTGSVKVYGAMPSVRFFAMSDAAGTVRILEYF